MEAGTIHPLHLLREAIMIYREFQDLSLSALGLGMMRLPVLDGNESRID